ncbi:MAG: phosphate signaling complex PhoU family protein [Acidimicrobiales bacterium]
MAAAVGGEPGGHARAGEIDDRVTQLFALVAEGLAAATDALLSGDRDMARTLAERETLIDTVYRDVEGLVTGQLTEEAPRAAGLRFLLSVLRIVPELERSHDLVEHIARRGAQGLRDELSPRARGLIERMGQVGVDMWRVAAEAWLERDPAVGALLTERDDEMDDLHSALTAELASGRATVPVAMDMALVARFYERLGDHAVNVARRISDLAAGGRETDSG